MSVTQKQRENLKPFSKGQSGNPGGLLKNGRIDKEVREALREIDPDQRKPYIRLVVKAMIDAAIEDHSVPAAQWLADRGFGKVTEKIDIENGTPLFEFVHAVQQNRITNELAGVSRPGMAN